MNDPEPLFKEPHKAVDVVNNLVSRIQSWPRWNDPEILARRQARDAEELAQTVDERRLHWNVPRRYLRQPRHHPDWQAQLDQLAPLMGTGVMLVLLGSRGTGKTYLGVELLKFVTGLGRSGIYRTLMEFFVLVRSTYGGHGRTTEEDVMRQHQAPALLVLDEVGKCGQTQWEDNVFFDLLNKRYAAEKDTVLVCNLTIEQLPEVFESSILSRIQETGGVVVCDWPSFRDK